MERQLSVIQVERIRSMVQDRPIHGLDFEQQQPEAQVVGCQGGHLEACRVEQPSRHRQQRQGERRAHHTIGLQQTAIV